MEGEIERGRGGGEVGEDCTETNCKEEVNLKGMC